MKNPFLFLAFTLVLFISCKPSQQRTLKKTKTIEINNSSQHIADLSKIKTVHRFSNPSFEKDNTQANKAPLKWKSCGALEHLNINLHSNSSTLFDVTKSSHHGKHYIALMTAWDETSGVISQDLKTPLEKNNTYLFHLQACYSSNYSYKSPTKKEIKAPSDGPVRIKIWGGDSKTCKKTELLAESQLIDNTDWEKYSFLLSPKVDNHSSIFIEAFFKRGVFFAYNGNVLIDNLSPIYLMKFSETKDK